MQSWGQLEAAKANIEATQAQVQAAEIALNGVREEARVGQRTTLDVLNAQQELVNARVALVTAQRDRVVASYTLLAAVGRLSPQVLALRVPVYDSTVHYHQVRDTWVGVRTPDGTVIRNQFVSNQALILLSRVHSSLRGHDFPSAKHVLVWRINGMQQQFRSAMRELSWRGTSGSVSGFLGNDANGEGARAVDGGNSCLHPAYHCRRRRNQTRQGARNRRVIQTARGSSCFRPSGHACAAIETGSAGASCAQTCCANAGSGGQ